VQLALAAGLRFPFPVRISGILFHPTLHYRPAGRFSPRDYVQRLRKRLFLRLIAQNPHLDTVFTLDPTAVPSLRKLGLDAVALPDPVIQTAGDGRTREEMRLLYGIEPGRRVLLLFGALTARKGVLQVLEAVRLLPPQAARSIALFLAGPLDPELRPRVTDLVALARGRGVQVVRHDAYIQNGSVQAFIGAADLVLAPYQRHFGSSAVLIRAALAERPVLSQEFGLMGAYVRQHGLGQAVDSGSPAAIAAGIEAFLLDPSAGFDPARSRQFVLANTPERFCETLLSRVHRARVPEPLLTHPL
jgi:glycosyltransferase involved in cell wall biosynthesis